MPLLYKKPFTKKKIDPNLKPNSKVFFCDLTEEVFLDYDEFWERLVLLNALVWTCELTGHPNLTFQEALESENKARQSLSNVTLALKRPIMYIASYTRRGKINDMSDDVFNYIRDRYFLGEEVEAIVSKHWYDCKVTRIVMPTNEEVALYEKEIAESDEDSEDEVQVIKPVMNGSLVNKDDDDDDDEICVLRDDHLLKKTAASCPSKNDDDEFPPFPTVKYEVVEIEPWDYKECKKHVVSWDQIRRPKSAFTREKCKVFLKQCVRMNLEGYWALKDILFQKYVIQSMVYSDIFVGRPPKFAESRLKKVLLSIASEKNEMKHKNKETKDKLKESKNNKVKNGKLKEPKCLPTPPKGKSGETKKSPQKPEPIKEIPKIVLSEEDMEALRQRELIVREKLREKHREEIRLRLERMRAAKKRERDLEKEEKRLMGIFKQFLNRKREDLECDDHLDLPMTTPIQCRIPNELFGDFIVILEFVNAFSDRLELKDVYSQGITFDMLEHSLIEKEIAGVFNDIVQLLLGAIFCLQEEEDEEVEEDTTVDMAAMEFESNLQSIGLKSAISLANKAATWSQQYQGVPLQKAPLDALTLTEVLRLHFLASGASNVANAFWRHVNRGGYKPTDDPGLYFKLDEPDIIKKLTTEPVFDLQIGEKIKVLNVLMSQILTYASVRDALDEKYEKLRETNNNLRLYRFAEIRKEKEELLAKKQKTRDEKLKLMKKKIDQMNKSDKNEQAKENEEPEKEPEEEDEEEKRVREEKEEKQRERRKQEAMKKEKEFIEKMHSLSKEFRLFPLGQDRAYRKYWLFSSLNGLFVEDWDPCIGTCLESPTPVMESTYIPEEDKGLVRRIQIVALKNLEAAEKRTVPEKTNSDKENGSPKANAKKPLPTPTLNGNDGDVICCNGVQNYNEKLEEDLFFIPTRTYDKETLKKNHSRIFGLCSADKDCPVHVNAKARQRWSFIHSKEVLQFLISSLNSRGNRESELKDSLLLNREKIELSLQNCLAFKLDPSQEPQVQTVPQRKSERNIPSSTSASSNLNFPPGTTMDRILELTLRDMILELEEKLHHGMLGSLKVQERNTWRDALVNGTSISFSQLDLVWGGKKRINQFKSDLGIEVKEEEELIDSEDYVSKDGLTQAGVVKELAIAILQVAQALEPKYLKKPLAESDKMIKKRIKAENRLKNLFKKDKKEDAKEESSSDDEDESFEDKNPQTTVSDNALRTAIERWEKSLMACTSFSQLFLHLATLDNSITWSRSAVNTRCSICRKKSDPENTLLCDQCDRGYHMYCLKPPIKVVPTGDWFCDKCKPKEKPKSPRKQRKIYKEESDEEEDEEEIEEPQASFVNHEYCDLCETGGEIICCDTCPRSFHFECANLRKVPRGNWSCPMCRGQPVSKKKKLKSGKKAVESNKREAKKRTSRKPSDESYTVENDDTDEDSIVLRKRGVKRPIEEVDNDYYHKGAIETLLNELISHDDAWPFGKPVHRQGVPDYYEKIKKPMDLRTLKMRFNRNKYSTDAEFIADSLLIFQNCRQYFKEDDPEYQAGIRLSKYFLRKIKLYKLADGNEYDDSLRPSKRRR